MRLVSWNSRGMGNPVKSEAVKDLLKIETPEILMLQETKIEGGSLLQISSNKWKKNAGKAISARGSFGGLATLWAEEEFTLESSFDTQHWIYTELHHKSSKLILSLFNLYVPVLQVEKKECWPTLADFIEIYTPLNIIVVGDLNLIFDSKEKRGGNNSKDQMLPLVEDLMHQWDLINIKSNQGLFTWTNNRARPDHIVARLDRFLVQSTLLDQKVISSKNLLKLTSDHNPILLQLEEEENMGPIPFRYNPLWNDKEGFKETVSSAWSTLVRRSPSFVWDKKLKATKGALKEWIKKPVKTTTTQRKEST